MGPRTLFPLLGAQEDNFFLFVRTSSIEGADIHEPMTRARERQGGGGQNSGVGKTSRGEPPRKTVSDPAPSPRYSLPPNDISLIKSLVNYQNFPQVNPLENSFRSVSKKSFRRAILARFCPPPPPAVLPPPPFGSAQPSGPQKNLMQENFWLTFVLYRCVRMARHLSSYRLARHIAVIRIASVSVFLLMSQGEHSHGRGHRALVIGGNFRGFKFGSTKVRLPKHYDRHGKE